MIHIIVDGPGLRTVALALGSISLPGTSELDNCQLEFGTEFRPLGDTFNHLWCKAGTDPAQSRDPQGLAHVYGG